jgi:hypothetical protein
MQMSHRYLKAEIVHQFPTTGQLVLLVSFVKVMEKIIRNALLDHVFGDNLVSPLQHGFVPGRSAVTQLLASLDQWTDIIDQGGSFDIVYLDFAKAFNSILHVRLTRKLESYSVTDKVLKWIVVFLTNRRQRVVLDGAASTWLPVISGVPQVQYWIRCY